MAENTEIKDVIRILTEISQKTWAEYKDDDKITLREIIGVITSEIPDVLQNVNFKEFTTELKGFKLKNNKKLFKEDGGLIDLIWAIAFDK